MIKIDRYHIIHQIVLTNITGEAKCARNCVWLKLQPSQHTRTLRNACETETGKSLTLFVKNDFNESRALVYVRLHFSSFFQQRDYDDDDVVVVVSVVVRLIILS